MTAPASIFPNVIATLPARLHHATNVIETVGVEVLNESFAFVSDDSKAPAHNDVIPFASTLRRVG